MKHIYTLPYVYSEYMTLTGESCHLPPKQSAALHSIRVLLYTPLECIIINCSALSSSGGASQEIDKNLRFHQNHSKVPFVCSRAKCSNASHAYLATKAEMPGNVAKRKLLQGSESQEPSGNYC